MIANFHAHRFVLAMSSLNQMSKAYLCQGTVLSTRFKQTGTYENYVYKKWTQIELIWQCDQDNEIPKGTLRLVVEDKARIASISRRITFGRKAGTAVARSKGNVHTCCCDLTSGVYIINSPRLSGPSSFSTPISTLAFSSFLFFSSTLDGPLFSVSLSLHYWRSLLHQRLTF